MTEYKILIVDDSIENLKTMVSVFEYHEPNYEIFQTVNAAKAIEIAKKIHPDLIITDWNMPELSGVELIKMFKSETDIKNIPIIMATGIMLTVENLRTALDAGAIDYIRKPIDPIELIARSKSALLLTSYYKQVLEQKDKDLTEKSVYLVKSQEFNNKITNRLNKIKEEVISDKKVALIEINKLKEELLQQVNEDTWYRFNLSFSNVHTNFNKNLIAKHPDITPAELKLCAFIKLGMNNKEIASVLNQSPDSIKTSRYRIRKKLNLEGNNFESYLSAF